MPAPCARYCSMGWAASPMSVMRPRLQSLIGGRSHKTHMRQLSILLSSMRTGSQVLANRSCSSAGSPKLSALLIAIRMKHRDQIEQISGAQRIEDEMHLLAGPERHVAPA